MKAIVLAISILLSTPAWSADLSAYYGLWAGSVVEGPASLVPEVERQHNQYEVSIELVPGNYTVKYPSLGCSGKLRLLANKGRHFRFQDQLEYGSDSCAFGGYTELMMIDPYSAAFHWFDNNGVLRAKGVLKRNNQTLLL